MKRAATPIVVLAVVVFSTALAVADTVVPTDAVTTRVVVRESASSQSNQVGSLRPGEQAELLGEVPNWYRVRLPSGIEGFVSKRWTRLIPQVTPPAAASFTIDVVDVGTGLGVLVRGQDFTLVYDGGSNDDTARGDGNRMLAYMRAVAPMLMQVDHVLLSHPHTDHVELLPDLFASYQIRHVWESGRLHPICGYRAFVDAIRNESGLAYHTVTRDGGSATVTFPERKCYGQSLPLQTVTVHYGNRLETGVPIPLGQSASMTILHADAALHSSINENTLVVRLDLGSTRVLLMGDAEAGGLKNPSVAPTASSIEGALLACCTSELSADILIAGHHGSMTSSRRAFLNSVSASIFIISTGPTKYGKVVLPDQVVTAELDARGDLFRTDLNDATCGQNPQKIGPDNDGRAGGCDNVRVVISGTTAPQVSYWRGID
jgi:competence protein ComEC